MDQEKAEPTVQETSTDYAAMLKKEHPEAIVDPDDAQDIAQEVKPQADEAARLREVAERKLAQVYNMSPDTSTGTKQEVRMDAYRSQDEAQQAQTAVDNDIAVAEENNSRSNGTSPE